MGFSRIPAASRHGRQSLVAVCSARPIIPGSLGAGILGALGWPRGRTGPPSGGSGAPAFSLASSRKVPMFGLEAIWRNGQVVGHIRRADFGFTIDKTLAYGYIRDPSGGPVS